MNSKSSTTIAVCETYGKNDQKNQEPEGFNNGTNKTCQPTPKYIITSYFLQNIENQPSILNTKTNCINISGELPKTKNARYTGLMECQIISIFSPVCIQPFD